MTIQTMSRPALEAAMAKAAKVSSALGDEMIAAGRGHETYSQTRGKSDPLSLRYVAAFDHELQLRAEANRRMTWHGKLTPVRALA